MLLYIVIAILIIGIIGLIVNVIKNHATLLAIIGICIAVLVVAFLALGWIGILIVLGACAVLFVILIIISSVSEHDKEKKETARINQETEAANRAQINDNELIAELNKNCLWLGKMDAKKWEEKLPNFYTRTYTTSFELITYNFAKQSEETHITHNEEWLEPFFMYIVSHGCASVTKMLKEVHSPQLKVTHNTPDWELLHEALMMCTKEISAEIPALLRNESAIDVNEDVFEATDYLRDLYKENIDNDNYEEISWEDL